MTTPSLVALSPCTLIRAAGPDVFRFLNGQLTNDLALATADSTVAAAALNAKGGLEAVCWIRKVGDDYLLDGPLALRDALMARLDRYLIADDVTLTDETDDWSLFHLLSEERPVDLPGAIATRSQRLGSPGIDLLLKSGSEQPAGTLLSETEVEALRIEHGIPAWGHELTAGMLPPEAGLDATMISYDKGCYLGQEVISRMKWAGKTNRHLVSLEVPATAPAPSGLFHEGAPAGELTSVSPHGSAETTRALGFRRRKFEKEDQLTLASTDGSPLQTVRILKRLS